MDKEQAGVEPLEQNLLHYQERAEAATLRTTYPDG